MPGTLSPPCRSKHREHLHYGEHRQLQRGGLPRLFTYVKSVSRSLIVSPGATRLVTVALTVFRQHENFCLSTKHPVFSCPDFPPKASLGPLSGCANSYYTQEKVERTAFLLFEMNFFSPSTVSNSKQNICRHAKKCTSYPTQLQTNQNCCHRHQRIYTGTLFHDFRNN